VGENTSTVYGPLAPLVPSNMKGGYSPLAVTVGERELQGRVDIILNNIRDRDELLQILRHEVFGHYGANTFQPNEKQALLEGLIAARNEPVLKSLWAVADNGYSECPPSARAEEVFALFCESIAPRHHVGQNDMVRDNGSRSFSETCTDRNRLMQIGDLKNIALMVASGLHDESRTQQNFPSASTRFKKEDHMQPKKPFHETVAEKLIEQLKAGTAPWQKPWEPGVSRLPMNPVTGKRYKGVNAVYLSRKDTVTPGG
jgi:putative DNA primase/helicase